MRKGSGGLDLPYWRLSIFLLVFVMSILVLQIGVFTGFVALNSDKTVSSSDLENGVEVNLKIGGSVSDEDGSFKLILTTSDSEVAFLDVESFFGDEKLFLDIGESKMVDLGSGELEVKFSRVDAVELIFFLEFFPDVSSGGSSFNAGGDDAFGFGGFGSSSSSSSGGTFGSEDNSDDEGSDSGLPWKAGDPDIAVNDKEGVLGDIQRLSKDEPFLVFGVLFGVLFLVLILILIAKYFGSKARRIKNEAFYRPTAEKTPLPDYY